MLGHSLCARCLPIAWGRGKTEKRLEMCKTLMGTDPTISGAGHQSSGMSHRAVSSLYLDHQSQSVVCSWAKQKQGQDTFNCVASHRAETATVLVRDDAFTMVCWKTQSEERKKYFFTVQHVIN